MRVRAAAIFKFFFAMIGRSQVQIRKHRAGKGGEKITPPHSANRSQALNLRKLAEQDALSSCAAWGILLPSSSEYYVPRSLPSMERCKDPTPAGLLYSGLPRLPV